MQVHDSAGQQIRAAGIVDADLAHHLADDDLDCLSLMSTPLLTVDLLDLLNDILLAGVHAADAQHVMRGSYAPLERLALRDRVAVGNGDAGRVRQVVGDRPPSTGLVIVTA